MISLLTKCLLLSGVLILVGALLPVRRLIGLLPPGRSRSNWHVMAALVVVFIVGYLCHAVIAWNSRTDIISLIVPGVFFFGACFVWLTSNLSLQTAIDLNRVGVLEREAATDPLTGVFNRRYLDLRLVDEITRAQRYCLPLSLLMLDIDHFKPINDQHGHQAGDCVLISVSELIAGQLRDSDVLTRYGGDEFIVMLTNTSSQGSSGIAERIRSTIASHCFKLTNAPGEEHGIRVTASIGLASLGDGVDSIGTLILIADENLYHAKQEGRNQVSAFADPPCCATSEVSPS